jgi:sugar lactone lactonase YvrE
MTHPPSVRWIVALTSLLVLVLSACQPIQAPPKEAPAPSITLLAKPMAIGFGSTVGPDDMLYVTDPTEGQILRIDPATGDSTVFASGLPKTPPSWGDGGIFDVTFIDNTAYALVSEVSADINDLDPNLDLHDIDGIYRIDGADQFTIIADIGAWSIENPPDAPVVVTSGVQYSFLPYGDGFVVNDGHHNRVLYVTLDGQITQVMKFDNVVPTGMALRGNDNDLYMSQAGPLVQGPPRVEIGQVVTFDMQAPNAVQLAGDIPLAIDVEFGPDHTLYALSQGTHLILDYEGSPADPNTGALLRINPDGTTTTVVGSLNQPTSVKFIGNTAYIVSYTGEIWKIENLPPAQGGGG